VAGPDATQVACVVCGIVGALEEMALCYTCYAWGCQSCVTDAKCYGCFKPGWSEGDTEKVLKVELEELE
jgi:hypothetical protein